ncbi:MAG: hypothetical protein KatS3mg012_0824 [Gaiellaceae bacterium]|jgi:superfamily II DNA/RNA helicase|nr:MAG: hypothetical protein KatS3mg012_0824 [Gaiellaceae bacterium]
MQQSFSELGVSARIVSALAAHDIHRPFPIQASVLPEALAGRDVLAKAPTGSGKTLAFAIPLVERIDAGGERPSALVLVPTRELASQVADEIVAVAPSGVRVSTVYGGVALGPQATRARAADVLVATPGRLNDLLEREAVSLDAVRVLVLDEADRMLDLGFKPQVDRIVRRVPRARQTMLFSATLDARVRELARAYTIDPLRFDVEPASGLEGARVEHRFVEVRPDTKVETLVGMLGADGQRTLVFVRTKRGADRLVRRLAQHGVRAVVMHGDLSQAQRERALGRFESGQASTLVATDVAARGIDLADVTHVVNYDPPEEHAGYVHRVGRTGRAGRGGVGVTLVLPEQRESVSRVARLAGQAEEFTKTGLELAPPRLVYSSRRGRSKWGAPRPARKI